MTRNVKRTCRTCGWSGTYSTPKRADYAKRQHSCKKQLAKAAARANGERIRAAIDRTPKPCHHNVAQHQHGTYACYKLDGCRCEPCAAANSEYARRNTREKAYGRWNGLVPADEARAHVKALRAQGMGWKRIASAAGLDTSVVWKLLYGDPARGLAPSKRIRPSTSRALLAVKLDLADGAKIDSLVTRRKLQALIALGWSQSKLAHRLGMLPGNFGRTLHDTSEVLVSTARAVDALFADLSMVLPPRETKHDKIAYSRAVRYARERFWFPPLAWDEIDDPTSEPDWSHFLGDETTEVVDEIAIERALNGDRSVRLTKAERAEAIRRWTRRGGTINALEQRTGWRVLRKGAAA